MPKPKKPKSTKKSRPSQEETCFVIMPFGGWFDDYYTNIYVPAIKGAGLHPHRADDLFRPSVITNDIWAYTKTARIVLADLTGKNPNVFYELGLAHALAKPAVLITESMEDVPFDLRSLRVILYEKNQPDWGASLRDSIESSITETLKAPEESVLPAFLSLKETPRKPSLTQQEKDMLSMKQEIEAIRRELPRLSLLSRRALREELGPDEAEALIRQYVRRDIPESVIIERLRPLGPPIDWIVKRIRKYKGADPLELSITEPTETAAET